MQNIKAASNIIYGSGKSSGKEKEVINKVRDASSSPAKKTYNSYGD